MPVWDERHAGHWYSREEMHRMASGRGEEAVKWRPTLFDTPCGPFWLPEDAPDDQIANAIKRGEVHDAEVAETILSYIVPGTTVIDVGACYGQMSLLFAEKAGPRGEVIAVEPSPFLAMLCRRNFKRSGVGAIILSEKAAWSKSGLEVAYLESASGSLGSGGIVSGLPTAIRECTVETVALEDLPFARRVSALKIDAEGADLLVLEGARKILTMDRPAVVFEFDRGGPNRLGLLWADVVAYLDSVKYRIERTVQDQANFLALPEEGIVR